VPEIFGPHIRVLTHALGLIPKFGLQIDDALGFARLLNEIKEPLDN